MTEGKRDRTVGIGDLVAYGYLATPTEIQHVVIIPKDSEFVEGRHTGENVEGVTVITDRTPLALALLGKQVGERSTVKLPGDKQERLVVTDIRANTPSELSKIVKNLPSAVEINPDTIANSFNDKDHL